MGLTHIRMAVSAKIDTPECLRQSQPIGLRGDWLTHSLLLRCDWSLMYINILWLIKPSYNLPLLLQLKINFLVGHMVSSFFIYWCMRLFATTGLASKVSIRIFIYVHGDAHNSSSMELILAFTFHGTSNKWLRVNFPSSEHVD